MIGIYKITNPKGKVYIGQSVNIIKRFSYYKNIKNTQKQTKLRNSISKYGVENHVFEIIESCDISNLNNRERYWQDFYKCVENGLNSRYTKSNDKSGKLSEETILRISENRKGVKPNFKNNQERSNNIRKALTGKKLSESHRKSLSVAQTGLKRNKEAILKSAESRRGLKMSEKAKGLISKSQTGSNNSFAKIVLNTETGIYYLTAKEAAESIGMTYNRFSHYINGRTKTKLSFIYV